MVDNENHRDIHTSGILCSQTKEGDLGQMINAYRNLEDVKEAVTWKTSTQMAC